MEKKKIICVLGNDGCGKSSLCQLINSKKENIIGIERSNHLGIQYGIDPSKFDKLTFEYTFNYEQFNEIILEDRTINDEQIYWIILDCQIDLILKRIQYRTNKDIWETIKSLKYYQQRYRHLGAHFGIPIIDTTKYNLEQVYQIILNITNQYDHYYHYYRQIGTKILNYQFIQQFNIENILYEMIDQFDLNEVKNLPEYSSEFVDQIDQKKFFIRWFVNNNQIDIDQENHFILINHYQIPIKGPIFKLINEGESKQIYQDITSNPFTKNLAFIILKSTIYSHSMQSTGLIYNLSSIRGCASQLFLEMMWRNDIKHSYHSINNSGIIISDFVYDIPPVEIVVKRFCEGTDKHSFYQILNYQNILQINNDYEYLSGPYVRFDWRNPNHISPNTKEALNNNPFYYLYEQSIGKEAFFEKLLSNKQYSIPVGDKNISEDLLTNLINVKQIKLSVLKMFVVIQSYFSRVDLLLKDICFMLNKNGDLFWSEINQDCMRITTISSKDNKYDKDIWRMGGSASRQQIRNKWEQFNSILIQYFNQNKFHETEIFNFNSYFYQEEIRQLLKNQNLQIPNHLKEFWLNINGKHSKQILVTMDIYNGEPVLVKSSKIYEKHSDGDYRQAMDKIGIFTDILIVDLNGAFNEDNTQNREIIKTLSKKYHVFTGGGLRTLNDIEDVLKSSVRRCVLASADDTLIKQIPKERLIIEMSINENNEILINGRQTNTHIHIIQRINQLIQMDVHAISITFIQTEGHLSGIPRQQIHDLISQIPSNIRKIYIAGGISSLDDLEYLWSFNRVIPQIGSAIWKKQLTIGNIFSSMSYFDENGLLPAIIQDISGPVKGLCFMNKESIELTCDQRVLYRYSRKLNQVLMKGQTSGHIQHIIKISLDCDSDSMLITVDSTNPFCHTGAESCFCLQTSIKANLRTLADHVKREINNDTYTGIMQRNPQLALAKVMEEFWEIMASHQSDQVSECSDLLIHFLMYVNGIGITIEDIFNELNARRWIPKSLLEKKIFSQIKSNEILIGITTAKYTDKTDRFAKEQLGMEISRYPGRNLSVKAIIIDHEKFSKYFSYDEHTKISLFPSKPKDMPWLLASKRLTHLITFETVIKNYPTIYTTLHQIADPNISLALIARKNQLIQPEKWSNDNKPLIAAEHVWHVTRFFEQNSIKANTYHLDRVTGSSEGFLINSDKYLLADAVVETGTTLEENNLQIWKVIIPKGQLHIALYAGSN